MNENIKNIVKEWIKDAEEELKAAKELLEKLPQKSSVHSQQAAEKFLKAFLAYHNVEILKTHNIERLIKECMKIDKEFQNLLKEEIVILSRYYFSRYPPQLLSVTLEEAEVAFKSALEVKEFVLKKLKL